MEDTVSGYDSPGTAWEQHLKNERQLEQQDDATEKQKPRKRGPRKMVDQPTQRFEGQMYVKQYEQGMQIVARLKREKASVPPQKRRRLTLNTLVRVAMTVLLEHRSALKGVTEEELLQQFRESLAARVERYEER